MDSSSSSTKKIKTNFSVRNQTSFKRSKPNNNIQAAKKKTDFSLREQTLLKKAYELSTLCEIQVCVIYYGRDGELIKTWPEDQSKVRDMAERFSKLSHKEKNKKSTNLSQFLNKKINDEKKRSLDDNKFSQKVLEMEDSLENHLQILQDRLRRLLYPQDQSEPDQSRLEQNHNFLGSSSGFTTGFTADDQSRVASTGFTTDPLMNLSNDQIRVASTGFTTYSSPSLINDHLKSTEQDLSRAVYNSGGFATDSLNHHQSKFSIFLYNHDNATFTPLADTPTSGTLPHLRSNGLLRLNPERVLEFCNSVLHGNTSKEALVVWQGLPVDDATWENLDQLKSSFPSLNIEDKLLIGGGSNDGVQEPHHRTSNRTRIANQK